MNPYKENPSSFGCLPQSLMAIIGVIFIFVIFLYLFLGDQKAAVIAEIIFVIGGFIIGFLFSFYFDKSRYYPGLFLSLPMIGIGLIFVWSLSGGKHVRDDMLILASSGFFVLISSSLGGYVGSLRKRKLEKYQN
jgi:hypothetical protein